METRNTIDAVGQRARELFVSGLFCAESVLLAITESRGIQSELIPKIATGFCAGIGRTGGVCGAVSGAVMAVSLFTGRSAPTESALGAYAATQRLIEMFGTRFGSCNCKELTGCDLGTEEGRNYFKEQNIKERCAQYTEEAARMAMTIIENRGAG